MKFRKKPVEIEAVQVTRGLGLIEDPPEWIKEALRNGVLTEHGPHDWNVNTLEGTMLAQRGDWIIRGVKGELYPCKPDIFAATYEPAP
jgi:hypothetical protein